MYSRIKNVLVLYTVLNGVFATIPSKWSGPAAGRSTVGGPVGVCLAGVVRVHVAREPALGADPVRLGSSTAREECREVGQPMHVSLEREVMRARHIGTDALCTLLKPEFYGAMRAIFNRFADHRRTGSESQHNHRGEIVMSPSGAEAWLATINGGLRGSEYKNWARLSELSPDRCLTFEQWVEIGVRELKDGKWWSVAYDMQACGVPLPILNAGQSPIHCERLDHILCGGALTTRSWCHSPLFDELERLYADQRPLPHRDHPSDHFPVQAVFEVT